MSIWAGYDPALEERFQLLPFLCGYLCVSLRHQDIEHVLVRLHLTLHDLREDTRCAAGYQRYTLLIHLYRLLLIAGLDIPEHHLRQSVAMRGIAHLYLLEVGKRSTTCAGVELHVGDNVEN